MVRPTLHPPLSSATGAERTDGLPHNVADADEPIGLLGALAIAAVIWSVAIAIIAYGIHRDSLIHGAHPPACVAEGTINPAFTPDAMGTDIPNHKGSDR